MSKSFYSNLTDTAKPLCAFVIYGNNTSGGFVTKHPIRQHKNVPVIGVGQPLTHGDKKSLVACLFDEHYKGIGLLPENLLAQQADTLIWYVKGKCHPVHFNINNKIHRINNAPYPNLIYAVKNGTLKIAAYKGTKRPTAKTALYHAPLMNIYKDTRVCTGSATLPSDSSICTMIEWEKVITDTAYSHINHDYTLQHKSQSKQTSTAELLRFWEKLGRQKTTKFPSKSLRPINMTLQEWLKR